jgi:hypothetical protein
MSLHKSQLQPRLQLKKYHSCNLTCTLQLATSHLQYRLQLKNLQLQHHLQLKKFSITTKKISVAISPASEES